MFIILIAKLEPMHVCIKDAYIHFNTKLHMSHTYMHTVVYLYTITVQLPVHVAVAVGSSVDMAIAVGSSVDALLVTLLGSTIISVVAIFM